MDAHEPAFEAVSPSWLFPSEKGRASSTDYVNFKISDLENNGVSVDPTQSPFGWIVLEGPESAIANLNNKRDGSDSDLVFLNCDTTEDGRARLVCTSDWYDSESNCHSLMIGGVAETIIELPSTCHAAKYAVARGISVSHNQSMPANLQEIANQTVLELEFDFGFGSVKRDLGDVFFRLDYDNTGGYWQDVVNSSTLGPRSLESRFVSSNVSEWQSRLAQWLAHPHIGTTLTHQFNQVLVSNSIDCGAGQSAYIHIRAQGNVTSTVKVASTVYGRLTPNPDIDHSHLLMHADLDGEIRLDVSISGNITSIGQQGVFGSVLFPALHDDKFEALGLAVIETALKADIGIKIDTDMEGNFTTSMRFRTPDPIIHAWPEEYHASVGTIAQLSPSVPFEGWVGEIRGDSELHVDFQPMVGARMVLDPKTFGDRRRGVPMAFNDQFWASVSAQTRVLADATTDSGQHTWNVSTSVGSMLAQVQDSNDAVRHFSAFGLGDATPISSFTDMRTPAHGKSGYTSGRKPDAGLVGNDAESLFKGLSLSCSRTDQGCKDLPYTCKFDLCKVYPDSCLSDDSNLPWGLEDEGDQIDEGEDDRSELFIDTGSPSLSSPDWIIKAGGKPRSYAIEDPTQPRQPLTIFSMSYPISSKLFAGARGAEVFPQAFDYEAVGDCGNVEVRKVPVPLHLKDGTGSLRQWDLISGFATEHIIELQTVQQFIKAVTTGILPSGKEMLAVIPGTGTLITGIPMSWFKKNWYANVFENLGLPGIGDARGKAVRSPNNRVFHALGSTLNRKHLVLTNQEINQVKAALWDRTAPQLKDKFQQALDEWIDRKICGDPALFLKWIKASCVVYTYVSGSKEVAERFQSTAKDVRAQLELIAEHTQGADGLPELWDDFFRDLTGLIKKRAIQWMTDRVIDITNAIQEAPKKPDNWQEVIADVNELSEVIPDWSLPTIES